MENKSLSDKELENVIGGSIDYPASAGYKVEGDGKLYNVVNSNWGAPCRDFGNVAPFYDANYQPHYCQNCSAYRKLRDIGKGNINGWDGYCSWEGQFST